jgi:hypothetical protein
MGAFTEAHQFKGVFADPGAVALADSGKFDAATAEKMRAVPPLDNKVSVKFADGATFDIQEDGTGQYLVLPPGRGGLRHRVHVGDWICQIKDGSFVSLTDAQYRAITGE